MESHDVLKQRFHDDPKHDPRNPSKRVYKDKKPYYKLVDEFGDPYKSNKSNKEATEHASKTTNIKYATIKDIVLLNYVANLDYVDLHNLCITDKSFHAACNDEMMKGILAITLPNVVFKMNVSKLLKELDEKIDSLIHLHYTELPKWVNEEMFYLDMKRKVYLNLVEQINMTLDGYHEGKGKFDKDMLLKDGSLKVELHKEFLAFALVSNEFEPPDYDDEIDLHGNYIILSKNFFIYLMTAIGKYKDYHQARPLIRAALFVRSV